MPNRALLPLQLGLMSAIMQRRWFVNMQARSLPLSPEMQTAFAENLRAMSMRAYRRIWREAAYFQASDALRHVETPTLITAGSRESEIILQAVSTLAAMLPHAEGRLAPGHGHGWNVEAPDLFSVMVRAWITDAPLPDRLQVVSPSTGQ
jgi:pimeloyl-ACP methyl ester carboxylesterase